MTTPVERELQWVRPLRGGLCVATSAERCGALGSVVFDRSTREPLLLGAHHVLSEGSADLRVWQPAPCGTPGCDCNVVGFTLRGRRSIVPWRDEWFYLDAAVARLKDDVVWKYEARIPVLPRRGMSVGKIGPRTGATRGVLIDERHVERVRFGFLELDVPNQLLIRPASTGERFANDGDSGALVCDEEGRAVGLLWGADGNGCGVACPIGPVLETLDVTFEEPSS